MPEKNVTPARLEAFSDGVIAIIITVMVLELKVPHEDTLDSLLAQWPVFLSYALSFLLVAEYWMNHQMLSRLVKHVDNRILWSNLLLLFAISVIPFFTAFMGENHLSPFSTAAYSACSLAGACAFLVLVTAIFSHVGDDPAMRCLKRAAIRKNLAAITLYACAVAVACTHPAAALALNFIVAMMYFLPNTWLEKKEK